MKRAVSSWVENPFWYHPEMRTSYATPPAGLTASPLQKTSSFSLAKGKGAASSRSSSVQIALGHRFVAHKDSEKPPESESSAISNVVAMSGHYAWLAAHVANVNLRFDPGMKSPSGAYAVAHFKDFLDNLLTGLVDHGVTYTAGVFMEDHQLKDGRWVPGDAHLFKLLANGLPVVQEANISGVAYDVEILISVAVNS